MLGACKNICSCTSPVGCIEKFFFELPLYLPQALCAELIRLCTKFMVGYKHNVKSIFLVNRNTHFATFDMCVCIIDCLCRQYEELTERRRGENMRSYMRRIIRSSIDVSLRISYWLINAKKKIFKVRNVFLRFYKFRMRAEFVLFMIRARKIELTRNTLHSTYTVVQVNYNVER